MIAILGDIHFSSYKPWSVAVSESFLDWFKNWEINKKGNSLILVGDLVHSHINGGVVISFLERLITTSNFSEVYICVGNHDKKKIDGKEELAYEFYKQKPHVHVYEEATEVHIENLRVLMLPYYLGTNKYGLNMHDYYSDIYKNKDFDGKWDLIVGHFAGPDNSFPGSIDCIENLDKIQADKICLGHIHTRFINPGMYIGSVFAGRRNENDYTRSAWIYDGTYWREQRLPLFNEFITISYPEDLPPTKALVPIYTILNCANEQAAREKYGDIFIRRTTASNIDLGTLKKYEQSRSFSSIRDMDVNELFDEFVACQDPPLPGDIIEVCKEILDEKKKKV